MAWLEILAICISLLLIGFFAGIEIAFASANKLSIELRKKQGKISGKTWGKYAENPTRFYGAILVGGNIFLVVYGFLVGNLLSPIWNTIETLIKKQFPNSTPDYLNYIRLFTETLLSTAIVLSVIFISSAIGKSKSNLVLESSILSRLTRFFYTLFADISGLFVYVSEWILKYIFNVRVKKKKVIFSKEEQDLFFQQNIQLSDEENSEINKALFENALTLSETKVRKCMIPRKEIEGIATNTPILDVNKKFIETQLSKLVVYDQNIDNITGYIHHLDLLKNPANIAEILHPIPAIPETMNVTDLMNRFSRERKSIAWIIDEFGGTAGIVTMEDLLEEIFGEIEDEYDTPESQLERKISEQEYTFSGRIKLNYLTEKFGFVFPDSDNIETLSGYLIETHGSIPAAGEKIIVQQLEFEIQEVKETRIETIHLKLLN